MANVYEITKIVLAVLVGVSFIALFISDTVMIYHYKYIRERQQKQYALAQKALEVMAEQIKKTAEQQALLQRMMNATKIKNFQINKQLREFEKITKEVQELESNIPGNKNRRKR